jgi:outer membrane protein OmpA-like peptidoglycan-associated protein
MRLFILGHSLLALALTASCSSPPAPPSVHEASRRPANSGLAVELQVCRGALHDEQLVAAQCHHRAQAASAALTSVAARQQALAAWSARAAPPGNSIYSVRFDFGSARADIPGGLGRAIVQEARTAPLVLLRGRTDGAHDSAADSRIARERAIAVRDFLVAAGVQPSRIRVTHQAAGDHVADNASPSGRALNRRVEIEIYRALPVATSGGSEP